MQCIGMRVKCVTRQLEINKQQTRGGEMHSTGCSTYASSKAQMQLPFPFAHKAKWKMGSGRGKLCIPNSVKHNACSTLSSADCNCFSLFANTLISPMFAKPGTVFEYFIICEYFCWL